MSRYKVLITVVTYPLPSRSYDELVCTAGVLENGEWIRIYPVPFGFLKGLRSDGRLSSYKYTWLELDLQRRQDDFRPESHSPVDYQFRDLTIHDKIGTANYWHERKHYCLNQVYTNLDQLIEDSKDSKNVSLATFKPTEIMRLEIEETEREWKQAWQEQFKQLQISFGEEQPQQSRIPIEKLPYKFRYRFKDDQGKESCLMIEDWEIGQLYWNCLRDAEDLEENALQKVKEKFEQQFLKEKDLYFFLGTTKEWHRRRANNPFVIIGLFYPPKIDPNIGVQEKLF